MKKVLVFHPALMPYRIDFFRHLNMCTDLRLYFTTKENSNQKLDQNILIKRLGFSPNYCLKGFKIGQRIIRTGLKKILDREHPDLVFIPEFTFIALKVVKIYSLCDDSISIAKGERKGIRWLVRWLVLRQIDGVVLTSDVVKQWYSSHYPKLDYIVFPILQEEILFRMRLEKSLIISEQYVQRLNLEGKKIFMFVGRFAKVKNLRFLLEVFSLYLPLHNDTQLVLVGDGECKDELEQLSFNLGISQAVSFVGHYQDKELLAWYNVGQVFVLSSFYEPFGCVVNEALLSGLYVLTSTEVGASALLSETSGSIFSLQSKEELFKVIETYGEQIQPIKMPLHLKPNLMTISFDFAFESIKKISC